VHGHVENGNYAMQKKKHFPLLGGNYLAAGQVRLSVTAHRHESDFWRQARQAGGKVIGTILVHEHVTNSSSSARGSFTRL
jgi:hypothetical protein